MPNTSDDPPTPGKLSSVLGSREVMTLAFGAMIGWSWVILSGKMCILAGSLGSMLAFLAGAGMVCLAALTYAELTAAMPRAGGELGFTFRAFGPVMSWICGWSLLLAYVAVCAFEAVALPTVLDHLFPRYLKGGVSYEWAGSTVHGTWIMIGLAGGLAIGYVNYRGLKTSAYLQSLATLGMLVVGLSFFAGTNIAGDTDNLEPLFTDGKGFFAVVIMTPFLFLGFDVIPQAAEEIKVPARRLGRLILISIAMAAGWYILVQWGVGLGLHHDKRGGESLHTATAMSAVYGTPWAGRLLVCAGLLGVLTSWNAFFVGGTRLIYAMARARMLPAALARLHARYQTPSLAIAFITGLSMIAPLFGRQALLWIVNAGSLATVTAYLVVALAFLQLRRSAPNLGRPFRTPCGVAVGIGAVLALIVFVCLYMPGSPAALKWPDEWAILLGWTCLGSIFFVRQYQQNKTLPYQEQAELILGEYAGEEDQDLTTLES